MSYWQQFVTVFTSERLTYDVDFLMVSWPLIRDQWLVLIGMHKKESQKELAFNQTIWTTASRPRFLTSAAAPGRLAFRRCPIAYRWKLPISPWTGILKKLQGALLIIAHVVKETFQSSICGQWPRYDIRQQRFLSASFLKLGFTLYGVSGTNHCVPRRTGHCPNYFICWYSDAASSKEYVLAILLP